MSRKKERSAKPRSDKPEIPESLKKLTEILKIVAKDNGIVDVFTTIDITATLDVEGVLIVTDRRNGEKKQTIDTKLNCVGAQISGIENGFVTIQISDGRTVKVDLEREKIESLRYLS